LSCALAALAAQSESRPCFEVLVVDNAPSAETAALVALFQKAVGNLSYITESSPGLHNARHRGMHAATGEILAFIDDDVEVAEGWINFLFEAFSYPDVVLVGGNNLPAFALPPPAWLERWWNQPVYKGRALGYLSILDFGDGVFDIDPAFVWGCNFSIRKEQLIQYGGFHPDAFPAEMVRYRGDGETAVSDAIRQSGARTLFHSGASVRHHVPAQRMTIEYFQKRAFAQGVSNSYTRVRERGRCQSSVSIMLQQAYALLRSSMKNIVSGGGCDGTEKELTAVQHLVNKAYWQGYAFHRQAVVTDRELFDWVVRKEYFS